MVHPSFFVLEQVHEALSETFFHHQESLLDFDWSGAHLYFQQYRQGLLLHMEHEEQHLLPLFERIGEIKRWPSKLYYGEHSKMRLFLGKIEARLEALCQMAPPAKRAVIELLELETSYKHLCEHHHERENQNFFPVLDQVTSQEEKDRQITRCMEEWQVLQASFSIKTT